MKKNLSILLVLLTAISVAFFAVGCDMDDMQGGNNNTSASPDTTGNTVLNSDGNHTDMIGDGESVIEGFVEGQEVNEADIPQNILTAIKNAGENMLISGISYATYVGKQTYRVILSETGMGTSREIYVSANGEVIPTDSQASPTANASSTAQSGSSQSGSSQSGNAQSGTSASPSTTAAEGK